MIRSFKRRLTAGLIIAVGLTLHTLLQMSGCFMVNVTPSLPLGLYRMEAQAPRFGDAVAACLPPAPAALALARAYVWAGDCPSGTAVVAKVIAALSGDTVEVTPRGVRVNGHLLPGSRPHAHDSAGRSMPVAWGLHVLTARQIWLYSGYEERSFDSRYYGAVPDSLVRGVLQPTWVRGAPYDPLADIRPAHSSGNTEGNAR